MKASSEILDSLKLAKSFIDDRGHEALIRDIDLVCQQLNNSCFGIAVLAPFNFGKSTLINSLLGEEMMPTKIVRTTGAVVRVKYGKDLKVVITLKSGDVIRSNNTAILKEFAVLNRRGERREDVVSVEVQYPNRLLKNGVEFFDLPGTNDSEAQNDLIRDQILQVDLVIQLLDARQPFTMQEQDTLREWLTERGIEAVIFVLNKANQLDTKEEKREVYAEVISITNRFKSNYLKGIKKLYRVDALPAIKAKQDGSVIRAISSGIVFFEAALLTIISLEKSKVYQRRLPRVIAVATQVQSVLETRVSKVETDIRGAETTRNNLIKEGQQREAYLRREFEEAVKLYQDWLRSGSLLASYQADAAQALESNRFNTWRDNEFIPAAVTYTQRIERAMKKSCDEFSSSFPGRIDIPRPSNPRVSMPEKKARNNRQRFGDFFNGGKNLKQLEDDYERDKWQAYKKAGSEFLSDFSKAALANIRQYEKTSIPLITFPIPREKSELLENRQLLEDLNASSYSMQKICSIKNKAKARRTSIFRQIRAATLFCKNYILCFFRIKWHRRISSSRG
jgi:GTP-binding protein EngB required for normal cell division/vacuolar-type H+-ATPase subunit H